MPKLKENFTLDEDISKWVKAFPKEYGSASEFVNSLLKEAMKANSDPYKKVNALDLQILELTKQKESFLDEIKQVTIEGNKSEREAAEKFISEQEEKRKKEEKFMGEAINILDRFKFLSELQSCADFEDFSNLRKKMMKQNPELFDKKSSFVFDISTLMKTKNFFDDTPIQLNPQEAKHGNH